MAEGESEIAVLTKEDVDKEMGDSLECAVCLQTCIHPAQLPCGHIFCFLCIKGIANQSKKCAMCRQEIPRDFIDNPNLLHQPVTSDGSNNHDGTYQWFYEGRNGWWEYDPRTSEDIEEAYKMDLQSFEILICGSLYVIDFVNKVQFQKNDVNKKRKINRELRANVDNFIGVAGLK